MIYEVIYEHCLSIKIFSFSFVLLENIAINKSAYQQTSYIPDNDTVAASNAVDGRRESLKWSDGQCAVSASGQTATWWVNLTSILSIHHITIYYMTNNWMWGISILIFLPPLIFIIKNCCRNDCFNLILNLVYLLNEIKYIPLII